MLAYPLPLLLRPLLHSASCNLDAALSRKARAAPWENGAVSGKTWIPEDSGAELSYTSRILTFGLFHKREKTSIFVIPLIDAFIR